MKWVFLKIPPGNTKEPISGAFFDSDDVSVRPGNALVREGIQNSLDAPDHSGKPVSVRIYLSGDALKVIKASDIERYMVGAWSHIRAEGNGLSPANTPKSENAPCNFLVFEDFNTTGLTGNQEQQYLRHGVEENNFYSFFRAEGQTDKDSTKKGSWGIGKNVFWRASCINTVFGVSVTQQHPEGFIMGKSIFKSHAVGKESDRKYQTGYFGNHTTNPTDGGMVMPIVDQECVSDFVETFELHRRYGYKNTGLSLIIPYYDKSINEKTVMQSVIEGYFYPILSGKLEVTVDTPKTGAVRLHKESLIDKVEKLGEEYATPTILAQIKLARWTQELPEKDRYFLNPPNKNCQWDPEMFSDGLLEKISEEHNSGRPVAIRVPMRIHQKSMRETDTHFDVYMRRVGEDSEKPTFIRDGLIIPGVRAPYMRGVLSLVVAEDRPIAEFLRMAENPSHMEWQHARLKDEYRGHKMSLEFVQRSVFQIIKLISQSEEVDKDLLADIFSIPKEGDKSSADSPQSVSPKVDSFNITRLQGGFSINRNPQAGGPHPSGLQVYVAYNTRRGNPIKKYTLEDFDVKSRPIQINSKELAILEKEGNCIRVQIQGEGFSLRVTGFDENRELYIMVNEVLQ